MEEEEVWLSLNFFCVVNSMKFDLVKLGRQNGIVGNYFMAPLHLHLLSVSISLSHFGFSSSSFFNKLRIMESWIILLL